MVYINEALTNPSGKDAGHEWLELWNDATQPVPLAGWRLTVNGKPVALGGDIAAHGYRVLAGADFHRALTNRELKLGLYDASGHLENGVTVHGSAQEGKSYSRFPDGSFHWTVPTPGAVNTTTHAVALVGDQKFSGTTLMPHASFTGALGSGILIALILSVFITSVLKKSNALPHVFRNPYPSLRR
jgi:hypothetical protein